MRQVSTVDVVCMHIQLHASPDSWGKLYRAGPTRPSWDTPNHPSNSEVRWHKCLQDNRGMI